MDCSSRQTCIPHNRTKLRFLGNNERSGKCLEKASSCSACMFLPERRHGSTRVPGPCLFLRDIAHDGVLCTFRNRSSPDRGKQGVVRQGRRRTVRKVQKTHPAMSLPSIQLGGPPCWASPLAFGFFGFYSL